jgi:cytochrome b561
MSMVSGLPARAESGRHAIRSYTMPAKLFHWLTVALVAFMVSSAVIAKQLNDGPWSDMLLTLHKTAGALTLAVVFLRLCYRVLSWRSGSGPSRGWLHWLLYAVIVLVPLAGWAGISDFGARDVLGGFKLPAIWPEGAGYADFLFTFHAYLAFGLLALVAVHIGVAMGDYMLRADEPDRHD